MFNFHVHTEFECMNNNTNKILFTTKVFRLANKVTTGIIKWEDGTGTRTRTEMYSF